ncbi:MAG: T9SS type A sorting domain-containing protein [Flavobacteriales bacterium]|nr:T9SS type A sorting domain-containing protein [Flavobacteriales bacterium]
MSKHVALLITLCTSLSTHAVEVFLTSLDATCFQCNGVATASASGGLPPYNFVWSPAPPAGQGTPTATGLCPGEYSVEVTDGLGNTAQASVTINSLGGLGMNMYASEIRYACAGSCSGWASIDQNSIQGTPPYTYDFPFPQFGMFGASSVAFAGLCPGETIITVTDANGCAGTIQTYISSYPMVGPVVISTSPTCGSVPSGSVTMPEEFGSDIAYRVQSATFDSIYDFGNSTGPFVLGGIPAGTHTVYYWWNQGGIDGIPGVAYCSTGTDFTIGSMAGPCGIVNGRVYHDADEDCTFNGFDLGQPYRVLSIEPGNLFAITDGNGNYQRNLEFDSYSIQLPATPDEEILCPAVGSAAFTLDNATPQATVDFANLSTIPHDLEVSLTSTNARPGFSTQVWISVVNNSAFPSGHVNIALSYDALLLNPSNAAWTVPAIEPYGSRMISFTANVPADIGLLGYSLNYVATVTNAASEVNTVNNSALIDVVITGSYDPNDKLGLTSSRTSADQYFLDLDDHIDYTVRFQNTGTAAAETVVIRDEIDTDFDITSLDILGASHDFTPSFGEGRELVFTFNDIDLPDSTTDLLGSQGFISYRIKPNDDIVVGDVLDNTAGIYFDFNPPIITNITSHVVDFSTGTEEQAHAGDQLQVFPNPASEVLMVLWPDHTQRALALYTIDGRSIEVPRTVTSTSIQLDLRQLDPGTYLLRSARGTARFVKH